MVPSLRPPVGPSRKLGSRSGVRSKNIYEKIQKKQAGVPTAGYLLVGFMIAHPSLVHNSAVS